MRTGRACGRQHTLAGDKSEDVVKCGGIHMYLSNKCGGIHMHLSNTQTGTWIGQGMAVAPLTTSSGLRPPGRGRIRGPTTLPRINVVPSWPSTPDLPVDSHPPCPAPSPPRLLAMLASLPAPSDRTPACKGACTDLPESSALSGL